MQCGKSAKGTNNDLQNTIQKTKDWATWSPLWMGLKVALDTINQTKPI
jgi:hypothetical protein